MENARRVRYGTLWGGGDMRTNGQNLQETETKTRQTNKQTNTLADKLTGRYTSDKYYRGDHDTNAYLFDEISSAY